ncbi:helix-turn-helix domain-containing protein [Candidatus Bipolaricaulota bacterium]|nr:helix-turn-helix domain-containing protein [Candidatus Bipolaricaulota bacterium]
MSESNQTKSGNEDYELSVKQAAKALGKSTRTIHRYIEKGKLSRTYVTTENGKEIRLKSGEIIRLAAKLNESDGKPPEGDTGEEGPGPFGSDDPTHLDIREVLSRYERTLYQLGEMSEKLKEAKQKKEEQVRELKQERDQLKVRLTNKKSQIETLREEVQRPFTFLERILGHRRES